MKTRHCDECKHFDISLKAELKNRVCKKGHKPWFYQPVSALDTGYGWKRKCSDFEDKTK